MEILATRVLRGPNYWSNYRTQLIQLDIDLKEFETQPMENLKSLLLNAEDDNVFSLIEELKCNIALFSTSMTSRIKTHIQQGKWVAFQTNLKLFILL